MRRRISRIRRRCNTSSRSRRSGNRSSSCRGMCSCCSHFRSGGHFCSCSSIITCFIFELQDIVEMFL